MPEHPQRPRPHTPPPPVPPPGASDADRGSEADRDASTARPPHEAPPPPPPWHARQPAGGPPPAPAGDPGDGGQGPSPDAAPATPPRLDDRERTLDPRVIQVWRITTTIGLLIPFVPASVIATAVFGRLGMLLPPLAVVLLVLFAGWYPRARFNRWRWCLGSQALELSYGVIVRTHEAVPYFRVQQIDVAQGPLDRLLDLATLQVTTASASGSASLPGVPAEQAPRVRAELLARASEAVSRYRGDVRDAV